ncbi:MAG TPA: alginate lyase family protein [Vicinamibacterales bacterium]|nr:alginate lyase family protein [Vicinamibacterales bacterium]
MSGGVGLLLRRVRRRVHRSIWTRSVRRTDRSYEAVAPETFAAWIEDARQMPPTLPGPRSLPPAPADVARAASAEADDVMAHRFAIFGTTHAVFDRRDHSPWFLHAARELPPARVRSYVPVEWHTDYASGYRWDPSLHYLDIRVAPAAGVDIKWPRELSRFQHVGALACARPEGAAEEFLLQVLDWIDANPVRRGVNWASAMDVAIRAVNWIWGLALFARELDRYPAAVREVRRSLHEHGVHLSRNLEYYEECTTNHYLADIAGLLYIGAACPESPEADTWLRLALQELVSESERQLWADGADFEASTHYHRLVVETFLSCAALAERLPMARRLRLAASSAPWRGRPVLRPFRTSGVHLGEGRVLPSAFYDRLERAAEYTAALTKPNHLVPQIGDNDSARLHKLTPVPGHDSRDHRHLLAVAGVLLGRRDLLERGAAFAYEGALVAGGLDVPPRRTRALPAFFPSSGVAVLRAGPFFAVVVCGANGQGGRGGHGHNDKGSLELNVATRDFIVDGGCPVYTPSPEVRNAFRSTAAHSTVWLEGVEQDRWQPGPSGLFRLPERARPRLARMDAHTVRAEHRGFGVPHERTVKCDPAGVEIHDRLPAAGRRWIIWNLAPEVDVVSIESRSGAYLITLAAANVRLTLDLRGTARPVLAEGFFSVGYGQRVRNQRLMAEMTGAEAASVFRTSAA